ncbi:MAG TPA: hypothetical protein DCQ64_09490 [Candidatus Rokubacteria bacterium]|nr:hypothetical protein [Candidatus Rokubacteria bacterium]
MDERELAVLNHARAEVAKMPEVLDRTDGFTLRIHCYSCRRDHRIQRSVHGTVCTCGSTSWRPLGACEIPPFPFAGEAVA